jgi:threonine dehydrogenase-like Zn-dependent dehydrogenase
MAMGRPSDGRPGPKPTGSRSIRLFDRDPESPARGRHGMHLPAVRAIPAFLLLHPGLYANLLLEMKALFFDGLMLHALDNYKTPSPGKNEALIRVLMAGICGTDMEIVKGYKGFKGVPGHEFVGVVEKAEGRYSNLAGKRVVGEINLGCGTCDLCLRGLEKHCPERAALGITDKDGVFAEYVTLPLKNLWEVPDRLSDEEAVFTEPLAAAFEVTEQVHVRPTDKTLVLGDGKLGLLVAFVLHLSGANVVMAGKHDAKLSIARQARIRTKKVNELSTKRAYEIVVEATGSAEGIGLALDLVKPRGTIVLKSTIVEEKKMNLTRAVIDEVTIVGSRCGPFPPALAALASGRIDVKPLISAIYPFNEVQKAFERAREKDAVKVLLDLKV